MLILPIFLLNALFIDVIRLRLAGRETEMAAKAGVRSVMSRYDTGLQAYGLYGLVYDEAALSAQFLQVAEHNLSSSVTNSTFQYIDNRIEANRTELRDQHALANPLEFERQILQEMKYRAPITYTLELAEPFKRSGASSAMSTASQFYDEASQLEEIGDKREEALDEAWQYAQQITQMAEGFGAKYEKRIERMTELADQIGLFTLEEIKASIKKIDESIESASDHLDSLNKKLTRKKKSLSEARKNGVSDLSGLKQDIEDIRDEINELEEHISELTNEKGSWEQRLKDLLEYLALSSLSKSETINDAEKLDRLYKELCEKLDEAQAADNDLAAELERIRREKPNRSAYLPDELYNGIAPYGLVFFSKYRTDTGKIVAAFQAAKTRWAAIGLVQVSSLNDLSSDLANLRTLAATFYAHQSAEEAKRVNKNTNVRKQKQDAQTKIRSTLNAAKSAWGSCSLSGSDPYSGLYKQLEGDGTSANGGLYGKYMAYKGEAASAASSSAAYAIEDDKKTTKSAMGLLSKLSNALESFRDELYVNEFALSKFNNRTLGLPAGSASSVELSQPESHPLTNQEAEYLLYGFDSCAKNYSAAYGEMFVLLLGIRTTEALMEPKSAAISAAATPMVTFLIAAAEGAYRATQDMNKLLEGESISVLQKIQAIKINYKQLLRLFYLLHSRDGPMMARMQSLLELNTGRDLTKTVTSIQGKVDTSVRLWFLPGFSKWFPNHTLGSGITGNRWQIERTAVFAYD